MLTEIERKINITYRWWRDGDKEVDPKHIQELEEHAEERIMVLLNSGYVSGELNATVDEVEYTGWVEIRKEE